MANRKNSHRRRVRVAVLMVLCGAVFAAFFARLAWMQFVRADYYADKAASTIKIRPSKKPIIRVFIAYPLILAAEYPAAPARPCPG